MEPTTNGGSSSMPLKSEQTEQGVKLNLHNGAGVGSSTNATRTRDENSWEEVSIEVPWGTIEGKWWGTRSKQPILALHGWQDNCGTFDRLCPLMPPDIPVLCIDLPGHGKSSHFPKGFQYFLEWDGINLIRRIVRKYGWQNITLMGHSMGGQLAFMYAASFPSEVHKLIQIDNAGPGVQNIERHASQLGTKLDKFLDYEELPPSKEPRYSYNEMIQLVLDAYGGSVDEESVKILMKRGMSPAKDGGYHFARDLRLKVRLRGMFTAEQVLAYAKRIRCPVLNIRASGGIKYDYPHMYDDVMSTMMDQNKHVTYVIVPGTHHVHLVKPEGPVEYINNFLLGIKHE